MASSVPYAAYKSCRETLAEINSQVVWITSKSKGDSIKFYYWPGRPHHASWNTTVPWTEERLAKLKADPSFGLPDDVYEFTEDKFDNAIVVRKKHNG